MIEGAETRPRGARRAGDVARRTRDAVSAELALYATVLGAIYLSAVCILPEILISQYAVPFYFGGTSLLIVVNVTMDTVSQIQSHLIAHQYGDLIKKAKLKTAKRR